MNAAPVGGAAGQSAAVTVPAGAAAGTRVVEPTEAEMTTAIMEAARVLHWRVAHFRPALTKHGWRTAVQGDGAGFPDLVMIHARAGLVWWVELKAKGGRLSPEQARWRDDLEAAGQAWRLVVGRRELTELIDDMTVIPRVAP